MLHPDSLLFRTGLPAIDRELAAAVGAALFAAGDRVRAVYLFGSYAHGTQTPASDLDLAVVLTDDSPREVAGRVARGVRLVGQAGVALTDPFVATGAHLREVGAYWLGRDGRVLWGDGAAATAPELPAASYVRQYAHASFRAIARTQNERPFRFPVGPPDPAGPWLGFDAKPVRAGGGGEAPGTGALIRAVFSAAEGLLAASRGVAVVGGKPAFIAAFRDAIGGEWGEFVARVYGRCRREWDYAIPADPAGRAELRRMCEGAVALQNEFLAAYHAFLQAELAGDGPMRSPAAAHLAEVVYPVPYL